MIGTPDTLPKWLTQFLLIIQQLKERTWRSGMHRLFSSKSLHIQVSEQDKMIKTTLIFFNVRNCFNLQSTLFFVFFFFSFFLKNIMESFCKSEYKRSYLWIKGKKKKRFRSLKFLQEKSSRNCWWCWPLT